MFTIAQWVLLVYGLLLIAGGIMGYVKAGSHISLFSGGLFGLVILMAYALGFRSSLFSLWIGGSVAAVLTIVMGVRALRTGLIMPSGLIALMSFATLIVVVVAALRSAPTVSP